MEKGKLIVIEGACDGIGKSTQFNLLKVRLEQEKQRIVSHHFPSYNTYQGLPVEKYLNKEYGEVSELSPYFINSLYALDRAITWYTSLKEAYLQGMTILLDRYTTSSIIYQSALIENEEEKKKFIDYVWDYEYQKLGIKVPDKVIFLNAPFDLVQKIRQNRTNYEGNANDIYEQDLALMYKVYQSALYVADYLAWDKVDCCQNNQMRSIENIHEEIYSLVKKC